MNRRAAGYIAEELAARRLEKDGYRILARNEKCAGVEVDIIAAEGGDLVFAEVKASSSEFAYHPRAAAALRPRGKGICAGAFPFRRERAFRRGRSA